MAGFEDFINQGDVLTSEEQREDMKKEKVNMVRIEELHDFPKHPFRVLDDDGMKELMESIAQNGLLHPLLVRERKNEDGGYEIIAGHRRKHACEMLGMEEVNCLIKDMTDEEAAIVMVDSNIQRENVLPSEKAYAYKIKNDALKKRGKRDSGSGILQPVKSTTAESISVGGESKHTVFRYIRLTELTSGLLDLVDAGKLGITPAVDISYLSKAQQSDVLNVIKQYKANPSKKQAKELKDKATTEGALPIDSIKCILCLNKPERESTSVKITHWRKYFPEDCTEKAEQEAYVVRALEYYNTHKGDKDGGE